MAMAAVTEEKEEGEEEERKSEESNNSDNLVGFISHATNRGGERLARRAGSQQAQEPCCWLPRRH